MMKIYINLFFCLLLNFNLSGQDDCASAISLSIGVPFASSNFGSTLDNDYGNCPPANYNSSVWYSFTTAVGMGSVNITFTSGTIGPTAIMTIVDDCTTSSSYSFIYSDCAPPSGASTTICGLDPNTTYYIQISSNSADQGTFDILAEVNPSAPFNDICEAALPIPSGPELLCMGGLSSIISGNGAACPDDEATGCMSNATPGVWYYFDVPVDFAYNLITFSPQGGCTFELYSSNTGCSGLNFETCHTGTPFFAPMAGTTYYVLLSGTLYINPSQSVHTTSCNGPLPDMNNGGNGSGGTDIGLVSCVPGDPIMPCHNDQIIWWSYTVGCAATDVTINIEPWTTSGGSGPMIDGGIMAMESDCNTIMAQYDPINGTGYVCSGIMGNQDLILHGIPAGTTFLIAVGSDFTLQGYAEVTVTEAFSGGTANNDFCSDAIDVIPGFNTPFNNLCSTSDLVIPGCVSQSGSSVWFYHDPGTSPQDITINVLSTGIGSPAIGAWTGCTAGTLASDCSGTIELSCMNSPFYIEVASSVANQGTFDIEIISQNAITPPDVIVNPVPICSGESTNLMLTIPNGLVGDIIISPHNSSSSDITGLLSHTYFGVNSAILDDILVNCGSNTELAVYEISTSVSGINCPSAPVLVEIPVYPKLNVFPDALEFCLPQSITLNAGDYITGGSSPYQSYQWYIDGVALISSNETLQDYTIVGSGFIQLNVVDGNGCARDVNIDITAHPEIFPFLVADTYQACKGNPPFINITANLQNGGAIANTVWVVLDEFNNEIYPGNPSSLNSYELNTSLLDPGDYIIEAMVTDDNGCTKLATPISITIRSSPNGEIYEEFDADCNSILKFRFYDVNGADVFGNGPDNNIDGIPDQFDLDNDGIVDFIDITWITPTMGQFSNNSLEFVPLEDGIYQVSMETQFNCIGIVTSPLIILSPNTKPTIIGSGEICEGSLLTLTVSPLSYAIYNWTNDVGDVLGNTSTLMHGPDVSPYNYYLEVETINGCINRDTFSVSLAPLPEIQLSGSTSFCPSDSTLIDAGGNGLGWTYQWYNSIGTLLSNVNPIYISIQDMYKVVVTTNSGCRDSVDFLIEEKASLQLDIVGGNICDDVPITLDAGGGFDNYSWTDMNNIVIGDEQTVEIIDAGTYSVEVMNGLCTGKDTIDITASESPIVDIISNIKICNGNEMSNDTVVNLLELSMNSSDGMWTALNIPSIDMGDLSAVSFTDVAMGVYKLVYTSNVAIPPCIDVSDTLTITVSDCGCPFIDIPNDLNICNTESSVFLNSLLAFGSEPGEWIQIGGPDNLPIAANTEIIINGASSGLYSFEYALLLPEVDCKDRDTLLVIVGDPPTAELKDILVCNVISSIGPTQINLNDLIISGNGFWLDPLIGSLDFADVTNLDFTGIIPNSYSVEFMTNDAIAPCEDITVPIIITVSDCSCPEVEITNDLRICNTETSVELNSVLSPNTELGIWDQIEGPENITIASDSEIVVNGVSKGLYMFEYSLINPQTDCKESDTLTIIIGSPPIPELNNMVVCNTASPIAPTQINLNDLIVSGSGIWINPSISGLDFTDVSNLNFMDVIPNTYVINFMTDDAIPPCLDGLFSITVEVVDCECPPITLLDPGVYCNDMANIDLNQFISISAAGQWNTLASNPSVIAINGTSIDLTNESGGMYGFEYTLDQPQSGCKDKDTLYISLNESPMILNLLDTSACNIDWGMMEHVLDLTNLVTGDEGVWIDPNGDIINNPTEVDFSSYQIGDVVAITYETTTAQAPCINDAETLSITIRDCNCDDPQFLDPPILCNEINSELDLQDLVLNDKLGQWTIIDNPIGGNSSLIGSVFETQDIIGGKYIVQFELSGLIAPSCQKTWQFEIEVIDMNEARIISDQVVCTTNFIGENTVLNLFDLIEDGFVEGSWLNSEGDIIDEPTQIEFLNTTSGDYTFTYQITNTAPCADISYDITILAEECSEEQKDTIITIGNIFSPNGDGINDELFPVSNIEGLILNYFIVYDRWGNKIFHKKDAIANTQGSGWGGKSNGKSVEQGVYVYVIEVQFDNGKKQLFFGDVTVVR